MQVQQIHSTPLYRVTKRIFTDSDMLVVAFDSWHKTPDITKICQGEHYLSSRSINHITVKCGANTWYQDEEFAAIIDAIREVGAGYRMIGYGSSMGGYAAISFYGQLGLSDAVAFCPQFSIDSSKVPFEPRWREEAAQMDFRHDFVSNQPAINKATVIYDPLSKWDSAHSRMIAQYHPCIRFIRVPFSGHFPPRLIQSFGILPEFVNSLLCDGYDAAKFRKQIKAKRSSSELYWMNMSRMSLKKRPELALKAAIRATECPNAGELEKTWHEKVSGKV